MCRYAWRAVDDNTPYAFCREVDDVVDEWWDAGVAAASWPGGRARWPRPSRAAQPPGHAGLMPLAAEFGIEQRHLQAVIEGCQMDLEQSPATSTTPACSATATWWPAWWAKWRRASLARRRSHHRLRPHAGLALQLTNIIRDVGEDAMRGRIYLP